MQSSREWGLFFVLRKGRKKGRKRQPTSAVGCKKAHDVVCRVFAACDGEDLGGEAVGFVFVACI